MISPPSKVSPGEKVTAAHHNALLDYVLRTTPRAGRNTTITEKPNGCFINAQPGGAGAAADGLRPFAVRRHAVTDAEGVETSAQWEVWLPEGSMAVGGPCAVLNPRAQTASGHETDGDGWYAIKWVENEVPGVYRIVAHGKQRARLMDEQGGWPSPRPYVFVGVEQAGGDPDDPDPFAGDPQEAQATRGDYCGDVLSAVVAVVTVQSGEGGRLTRSISQSVREPIVVEGSSAQPFDLVWSFQGTTAPDKPTLYGVACIRQHFVVGGTTVDGESDDDALAEGGVMDMDYVWLKIDTGENPYAIEIVPNSTHSIRSTDLIAWVRLYTLKYNQLRDDERRTLNQVPIYRSYSS